MLHRDRIKSAADDIVAAALLGEGWREALARFATAADARYAVLMRNNPRHVVSVVATEEAMGPIAEYLAGRVPPNSRYLHVNRHLDRGFRVDHDDYTDDQLARDPYYQEFLRAYGLFWHANVMVASGREEYVELSLKRRMTLGPYSRVDAETLDGVLPELHAAARIAKATLDAEARGMAGLLRRRGERVIEIDARGRVLPGQAVGEADPSSPLRVRGQRLASVDPVAQPALDRAVRNAASRPGRPALIPLAGADGRRHLLQLLPVPGFARDVFLSATAIAVLFERDRPPAPAAAARPALRDAFGLTDREAEVASLIAEGLDIAAVASRLGIRLDTARTYLKDAFEKTGTHRQAELAALLARLGQ